MKKVPNRKVKVKLNKIILQILLLILVSIALITQKENILNIFTNKNKIKAEIPADMKIGDIIKYDHKKGVKPEDLKTTIKKGTASIPGSGRYLYKDDPVQEQIFDASNINTTWHVWSVDRDNDEIMIVSGEVAPFKTYGAIDYIWYEHNMHQIASIFGHGKGAKKKAFTYKVGSQLEDTGDTATWKTGTNGIPLTGARPLRTEDIEKAFGWTESTIKSDSNFTKNSESDTGYGGIYTRNIYFPQRDTGNSTQQWADKNIAKAAKQDVKGKDGYYYINKSNVPEGIYRNILWDGNGNSIYQLGQVGLDVHSSNDVGFRRGVVDSACFRSADGYFVDALGGYWGEYDHTIPGRVVAFLSSSDIVYHKSRGIGTHGESVWDIMMVGDIIKYNHKDVLSIEDGRKNIKGTNVLKMTVQEGTASLPGSAYEQNFDANKIDTNWHVWGVDEVTGDVIIVSDNVAPFKTASTIDYIWYEHNMHKIASIFGHGKGAKKKEFTYKVGSQLEDTGDTATWKTGIDGIPLETPEGIPGIKTKEKVKDIVVPLSGARPLRTEDIEKAFGWTESSIKTDSKFRKSGENFGGTTALNINYPQRKVEGINQTWDNEQIAKGPKKNVTAYNRDYNIYKDKIIDENDANISEEKKKLYKQYINILWDWNNNNDFQLGQVGLEDVYSSSVGFGIGVVDLDFFHSARKSLVIAGSSGHWYENIYNYPSRVVAFLSSSDIIYRKTNDVGENREPVWNIELKNNPSKNIKVNMKNEFGENLSGVKFNLNADGGASVLSRTNLNINSGSVNTFNGSNVVMKDNKYKMEVLGLPTDADYKIISKYEGDHELEQDIVSFGKEDLEYDILIYRKDGDYPVSITYDEGAENDPGFSLEGKIKLMDGENLVDTLDVTLKKGNNKFKFTDVKYFIDNKFKNYTIKYEGEGEGDVKVDGNALNVKYIPPKKNYTIKAEFIFDKTLDSVPVKLFANGKPLKDIDLLKSEDYIHVENLPERDSSGNPITYTIQKGNIPSGYITEISGLTIIIRPVLTLPMTGSDSLKMLGITFGICTSLGFVLRKKKKMKMLNFNGVMK